MVLFRVLMSSWTLVSAALPVCCDEMSLLMFIIFSGSRLFPRTFWALLEFPDYGVALRFLELFRDYDLCFERLDF